MQRQTRPNRRSKSLRLTRISHVVPNECLTQNPATICSRPISPSVVPSDWTQTARSSSMCLCTDRHKYVTVNYPLLQPSPLRERWLSSASFWRLDESRRRVVLATAQRVWRFLHVRAPWRRAHGKQGPRPPLHGIPPHGQPQPAAPRRLQETVDRIAKLHAHEARPRRFHRAFRGRLHDQPWRYLRDIAAVQPAIANKVVEWQAQRAGAGEQTLRGAARQQVGRAAGARTEGTNQCGRTQRLQRDNRAATGFEHTLRALSARSAGSRPTARQGLPQSPAGARHRLRG